MQNHSATHDPLRASLSTYWPCRSAPIITLVSEPLKRFHPSEYPSTGWFRVSIVWGLRRRCHDVLGFLLALIALQLSLTPPAARRRSAWARWNSWSSASYSHCSASKSYVSIIVFVCTVPVPLADVLPRRGPRGVKHT